jgi:quinone-modifying oxidoreductase subunit QmoA
MAENNTVLVIGGGFSGLTAAVEAAEAEKDVVIVEKNPYLGGRVAQLNKYFWKLCPPACGLEIQFKRIKNSPRVQFYTTAQVEDIKGEEGNFDVTIKLNPRYVNDKCVGCDACAQACPSYRDNEFNFGMDKTKAAYLPFSQAFPQKYVIDSSYCKGDCGKACKDACKYDAIDLGMKPETINIKAGAIIMATGWNPYDAKKIDNLGFGKVRNVITNMMMERLSAPNGPTQGRIVRPSDGKEVKNIAFVQCAGSRDENHLLFCSYICCLASLKQSMYVREQYPDSKAEIFYIDLRTPGLYEHRFLKKAEDDPDITLTKGKVAGIEEDADTKDVIVEVEDIFSGSKVKKKFDMVVLAAGMEPSTRMDKAVKNASYTPEGFVETAPKGVYAIGTLKNPVDVVRSAQDATAAVIRGIQSLNKGRGGNQ